MNKSLSAAIEYLSHFVDTEEEDFILKDDARVLIAKIKSFSIYETRRRMGRHAREEQRKAQSDFVQTCYRRVDELVRGGMWKTAAAKQVSDEGVHINGKRAHVEYETILKHYYRHARLVGKQNHR